MAGSLLLETTVASTRPKIGWLTVEHAISLATTILGIFLSWAAIKSDIRDLNTRMDQHSREIQSLANDAEAGRKERERLQIKLAEMQGDIKVIRQILEHSNQHNP